MMKHMKPPSTTPQPAFLPVLMNALVAEGCQASVSADLTDLHIAKKQSTWTLRLRMRSLPDSIERILEPLVLHALRQRTGADPDVQNTFIVVRIPKFPHDRERIRADMTRMIPPDPKQL
jgi:hypothetical protein